MLPIASILTQLLSIFASLVGISFIIVFHEFGHYIFCKIFNVYTPTFSIGIGKVLCSKKIGDTNFCISAGPIGGYVEVASESGINGSVGFNQIPYYQKVLIMLGGIFFNFLLTYFIFIGLFFTGMPDSAAGPYEPSTVQIAKIEPNSINQLNLQNGDTLISLNNQPLKQNLTNARKIIAQSVMAGATSISAEILRNGSHHHATLALKGASTPPSFSKQLEIFMMQKPGLPLIQSVSMAYKAVHFYLHAIASGLKEMISARSAHGFVGPVMAVAASSKSAQKGASSLLFLLAIISINLGFMNLLPLPIFDGGQFVIFTTETLMRRELSERIRHMIGVSSWVLAIGLLVVFTIRDLYTLIWH
ncbi:site-2 protease family protein [Candidatus Babeliales bacterium]|nr:site-2 protease family protein [Candidatus Babeliales bacterium]